MKIGHEMILASAGSGKTYALTNRFVRLLAMGARPERIVALTFTRKAAGEFFDEILKKLARAAAGKEAARALANSIGMEQLGCADFLRLLRDLVEVMPRLRLGTFDGFFGRIAKNFPLELGLSGEFEVLDEHTAEVERRRVMRRMFARSGQISEEQKNFMEAFKLATFGTDDKRPVSRLSRFIEQYQETVLAAPDPYLWGNPEKIWPSGNEWLPAVKKKKEAIERLRKWVDETDWDDKRRAWWDDCLMELSVRAPGSGLRTPLKNLIKALPEMEVVMMARKRVEIDPVMRSVLRTVTQAVIGEEYLRRLAMTQGIYAVISHFEAIYHEAVRRMGKLSFADVQRLLLPSGEAARLLSGEEEGDRRLMVDYRLDGEIDHWLLDEFQDTSHGQWAVLKNLIDEAVQDPNGTRSLFYVGDVKQAIYAWRDGDPRLFREIFDRYNEEQPGAIEEKHLEQSWRSGPPVIEMVNRVFGDAAVMEEFFPEAAANTWNREWRKHTTAKPKLSGQAALLYGEDEEDRFAKTLEVLREIKPLERGLTVAVLVQRNSTAAQLADFLRSEGNMPAIAEADLQVCVDNPVGAVLLALFKAAAHPGDTLAWEHVHMTPLGEILATDGIKAPDQLTRRVLRQIYDWGYEETSRWWWTRLEGTIAKDDGFSRLRARQFLAAASRFDATDEREVMAFIDFMTRYTLREIDSATVIRVMTIHKSKGLGFDVVLLPDLEGQKLAQARDGLAVRKTHDHEIEWVLDMPPRDLTECDEVLTDQLRESEATGCYEKLSLLYVAMTRAKRGLYLVTTKPKANSKSNGFTKLLEETLRVEADEVPVGGLSFAGGFSAGQRDWFREIEQEGQAGAEEMGIPRIDPHQVKRSRRLVARRPSDTKSGEVMAGRLFELKTEGSLVDFGRRVHALFAQVGWADSSALETLRNGWDESKAAERQVWACLQAKELSEVWRKKKGAELWRERMFETVIEDTWVTGVFDRVIVERDDEGKVRGARVYDFKTDEDVAGAVERHRKQLNLYRQAAARLLNLPLDAVDCFLVMSKTTECLPVPQTP